MTLQEFIVEQTTLLTNFANFWHAQTKGDNPHFVGSLEPHQWDEQFELFRVLEGFAAERPKCKG